MNSHRKTIRRHTQNIKLLTWGDVKVAGGAPRMALLETHFIYLRKLIPQVNRFVFYLSKKLGKFMTF